MDREPSATDSHTNQSGFQELHPATLAEGSGFNPRVASVEYPDEVGWWQSEPDVGRVAHGVAHRVDRLKAIGNGQVPAVAALAWEILHVKQ